MKLIKINESQQKRLFEAYQSEFSFEKLEFLANDWEAQYDYCRRMLGEPDYFGSSRCVFTLSDNFILKLAVDMQGFRKAGIDQNRAEYELYERIQSPLLTRQYGHDKGFTYLISENVVPATSLDFEKIIGIPFDGTHRQKSLRMPAIAGSQIQRYNGKRKSDYTVGFDKYFNGDKEWHEAYKHNGECLSLRNILYYIECNYVLDEYCVNRDFENIIYNSEWLKEFVKLVRETGMSDFCQVENFGMANREGKPTIVVLDSGLNLDVWEKHYKD